MTTITVTNPALMDRIRIQALLRDIERRRGQAEMLKILSQAIETEFRRLDQADEKNSDPV